MRTLRAGVVTASVMLSAALATAGAAAKDKPGKGEECTAYYGPFSSQTGDPCESPIGLCTHGQLEGEFPAQYDFTFETMESAGDPNDPTKFVYTGYSVVTALDGSGVLYTTDTGVIHMNETGPAPFVTKAIVTSGTGDYKKADGGFVATGNLTFETGSAVGSFSAVLCDIKSR